MWIKTGGFSERERIGFRFGRLSRSQGGGGTRGQEASGRLTRGLPKQPGRGLMRARTAAASEGEADPPETLRGCNGQHTVTR